MGYIGRYKVAYDTRTSSITNDITPAPDLICAIGNAVAIALGPNDITTAPDLMCAIRNTVSSAMSKRTSLLD